MHERRYSVGGLVTLEDAIAEFEAAGNDVADASADDNEYRLG